jgi:hypothetical protein
LYDQAATISDTPGRLRLAGSGGLAAVSAQ